MRELEEETGLTGSPSHKGIMHKMDYDQNGKLLEDKYFFIVRVDNVKGTMIKRTEESENMWLSETEIFTSDKLFHGLEITIKILNGDQYQFVEKRYDVIDY
jgi:8-oxo-dGTP pyrophosphatase MutT (NUDIX family)